MRPSMSTGCFQRSEGDKDEANSRDCTVSYSPVAHSELLLLPRHLEIHIGQPPTLQSKPISQEQEQSATIEQQNRPRGDSDPNLRLALEIYLEYLPLIQNEACQSFPPSNTMKSYKVGELSAFFGTQSSSPTMEDHIGSMPQSTTPTYASLQRARDIPIRSVETGQLYLTKSEEVLTGPQMEEIHSNPGKRSHNFLNQVAAAREIPAPVVIKEETMSTLLTVPTPPIPRRNPARLLRGKVQEEVVIAISSAWQQRKHNQLRNKAASANFAETGDCSSIYVCSEFTQLNSSETTDGAQSTVADIGFQNTDRIIEHRGEDKNEPIREDYNNDRADNLGHRINIEKQLAFEDGGNSTTEVVLNAGIGHNVRERGNGFEADKANDHTGEEGLRTVRGSKADSSGSKIGLGINVYGQDDPFGHSDEEEDDLDVLVELILIAHDVDARDLVLDDDEAEPKLAQCPAEAVVGDVAVAVPVAVAPTSTSSSTLDYAAFIAGQPTHKLIDSLLEENYRGQAETFTRNNRRASSRYLSHSAGAAPIRSASRTSALPSHLTPSRYCGKGNDLPQRARSLPTPSGVDRIIVEPFRVRSGCGRRSRSDLTSNAKDLPPSSPHITYGHRFYTVPGDDQQLPVAKSRPRRSNIPETSNRGIFYFTDEEREAINQLVHAHPRECGRHTDCTECSNTEYAYFENKAMPTSIPPEERNKIISNNRSLRTIKNELEALAETGAISDEQYDTIMNALPAESALSGTSRTTAQASPPPAASFTNLSLNNNSPPAYGNASPPSLPGRENPSRPELTRANALYRYAEPGDCNFEVGDQIAVYEYMNADWWLGKNLRTGQEGVFPVNYVQPQANPPPPPRPGLNSPPSQGPYYGSDKAGTSYGGGYPAQPQQYQDPPPPAPSDPYNSAIPPMQMANQPVEQRPSKGAEMGKKFGKKLGNAAIFGAGATIGSDIVNSIF